MALQKDWVKFGVIIPNTYIKINSVDVVNKMSVRITFTVLTNDQSEKIQDGIIECAYENYLGTLESCYNHLKTLPEFVDATDV